MDFDDDLANVQARVESLAEKMSVISKADAKIEAESDGSSLSSLFLDTKSDPDKVGSADRSSESEGINVPKRFVAQGRSPIERALVKSMNHLSTILTRLQSHDSLLSGTSSKSSPDKI